MSPAWCMGRRSGRRGDGRKEQFVASLRVCARWLGKLGSMKYVFRRVNADEVALRMVKSKVNFLSQKNGSLYLPEGKCCLKESCLGL